MTKDEAISYLQQLYPNGGHCWLDEQRIEAISMAINALQEEPVYTDFTKALAECIHQAQGSVVDPMVLAEIWKDELIKLAKSEEPVSEELKEAAIMHYKDVMEYEAKTGLKPAYMTSFKAGAQWQFNQLEKNRLAACDRASKEEIEREQDFCDKIIIGEHRQPTYSDAIEYGIDWQKKKMMKDAVSGKVIARFPLASDPLYNDVEIYLNFTRGLSEGDKVKVIIINDD